MAVIRRALLIVARLRKKEGLPVLVLDNGQTPNEVVWEYHHIGKAMKITMESTGMIINLCHEDVLTVTGTPNDIRECQEKVDDYLATR